MRSKLNRMLDAFDLDPRVYEVWNEVEAQGGTILDAHERLVAEGFADESSRLVVDLFNAITEGQANVH